MPDRPLTDDEVFSEMSKMVAFIKQEALEKAREIRVKADEEFAIEKAKLVRQEQQAIDQLYEKKRKDSEIAQKIEQSTQTNKARLKQLQRREENLQDLFTAGREKINSLAKEPGRYTQLLEMILLQSYLQLLEPDVVIVARKKDGEVVKKAAEGAKTQYKEISGRDVNFTIEGTLSDNGAGGVKTLSGNRRITLDNTLDERLRLLEDEMLPEIRLDLYGPNTNRKFNT